MGLWKKITGIIGGSLQLDFDGPKIEKSSNTVINIRDKDGNDATINVNKITGLGIPSAGNEATNKTYVDAVGVPKAACRLTTTTNHSLNGLADIDGETPIADDRILVQGQTDAEDNGIYDANAGDWTRSSDADGTPEGEISCGMYAFITEGDTYGNTAFILITENPISVGTTELVFTSFGGGLGSAYVTKALFDANTILAANSDDTPIALPVAASTIVGRASAGSIDDLSATQVRTIISVEENADVTDSGNVTTALGSINANALSDITSAGANIEDAVTKRHSQNTDTQLDSGSVEVDADDCFKATETIYFDAEFDNGNSGASDTISWKVGNKQKSTLTANCTYTFTAPSGPCNLILHIVQDTTAGWDITWPAAVKWLGAEPTWTDGGNSKTILVSFYYDGTNYWGQGTPWEV